MLPSNITSLQCAWVDFTARGISMETTTAGQAGTTALLDSPENCLANIKANKRMNCLTHYSLLMAHILQIHPSGTNQQTLSY